MNVLVTVFILGTALVYACSARSSSILQTPTVPELPLSVLSNSTALSNATDCDALWDLYMHTGGATWYNQFGWDSGESAVRVNCCTTLSSNIVACDSSSGRVTMLTLVGNHLTQSLPDSLGKLTSLQYLDLSSNDLRGPIPSSIGNLTVLKVLKLSNNFFHSSLPASLGSLEKLTEMRISLSDIVGSIPASLGNLSMLQFLDLSWNQLNGSIPPSLGNLSALTLLDLSANQLAGTIPPTLGALAAVEFFYLHSNKLSGSIPASLGNLTRVRLFRVSNNALIGSIPPALGGLKSAWELDLSANQLTGSIPTTIGQLANVLYLNFFHNQLSGPLTDVVCGLRSVRNLQMLGNQLSGSLPQCLDTLSSLAILDLSSNQFSGPLPALSAMPSLQYLSFSSNELTGSIPHSFGNLTSLMWLDLSDNDLTGFLPASLGNLPSLSRLWVSSNHLSGAIPDTVGMLRSLISLKLSSNQLTGTIPSSVGDLRSLDTLDLSDNQLSGIIPDTLGNCTALRTLYLHSNQLSGAIPTALGELFWLTDVRLFSNQLSGTIPFFTAVTNLQYFDVSSNQLSGPIPPFLGLMSQLKNLVLANNFLSGTLSSDTLPLSAVFVNMHHNNLTGAIPDSICGLPNLQFLYLSSNRFVSFPDCVLPAVAALDLSANLLSSFPFQRIPYFAALLSLDLSFNNLTGDFPIPLFLGGISLRSLSLAWNRFQGPFPISPCGVELSSGLHVPVELASGLIELDLSGNVITGIPGSYDRIGCVPCALSYYTLSTLRVASASLPARFLPFDFFGGCQLGRLRFSEIFKVLPGLRHLDLSNNNLDDGLDFLFDSLPILSTVDLRNNPRASITSSLSPSNRRLFNFDPSSAYPFSSSLICYIATIGALNRLTFQSDPSFFSYKNCICRSGYFGKPPHCNPCLSSHASCSFTTDATAESLNTSSAWNASGNIVANNGYYASPNVPQQEMYNNVQYPSVVLLCAHAGTDLTPCQASIDNPCAPGYRGRLCAACSSAYFRTGDRCLQCPEGAPLVLFGILVSGLLIGIIMWSFFVGASAAGPVKVLLFFVQAVFFIPVPMPSLPYAVIHGGSSVALVSFAGPECFFHDWDHISSFIASTVSPLAGAVLSALIFAAGRVLFRRRTKQWIDRCRRSALFLCMFFYIAAVRAVLMPLACTTDPGDRLEYLVSLPAVRCSATLRSAAVTLAIVYLFGLPAFLVYLVWRSGAMKRSPEEESRRQFVYSLLYGSYRRGYGAWELVVTARRVLFVAGFVAIPAASQFRTVLVAVVLGASIVLQVIATPYTTHMANGLEITSLVVLLINLAASSQAQVLGVEDVDAAGVCVFVLDFLFIAVIISILLVRATKRASGMFRSWAGSQKDVSTFLLSGDDQQEGL